MKQAFALLLALFAVSAPAFAMTIEVPASVPENVSFGFRVGLDSTEKWTKTSVKIDGASLVDVYSNGTVAPDPQNGQFALRAFVIDADPSSNAGLSLFVSHLGLPKGNHTVAAVSEISSDSKEIVSFTPVDESYKADVQDAISGLDEKISGQEGKVDDLTGKVANVQKTASQIEQKVEKVEGKVENNLGSRVSSLETQVDSIQKSPSSSPVSGLINLVDSLFLPLGIVAVIIIIAGVIMLFKDRLGGTGGSVYGKDEFGLPASKDEEEMATVLSDK